MSRFSTILLEHFEDPRNFGRFEEPDRSGKATIPGGGSLSIFLRLDDDRVCEARFETFGCGVTIACGSMLTEMIEGRSIAECLTITADELSVALGGVPPDKRHCPIIAVNALHAALQQ